MEQSEKRRRTNPSKEDYGRTWKLVLQHTERVDNGCMVSTKSTKMYPKLTLNGRIRSIHIVTWELHHGNCIEGYAREKGLHTRHMCGNARCYNPDHLKLGTAKENSIDKRRHGTMREISKESAREIYELKGEMMQKDIAKKFGVSVRTVCSIHKKRTHKYLHNNSTSDQQKDHLTHH